MGSSLGDLSLGRSRSLQPPTRRKGRFVDSTGDCLAGRHLRGRADLLHLNLLAHADHRLPNSSARRRSCRFVFGRPSVSAQQTYKSTPLRKRARSRPYSSGALSHNISESRRMPPHSNRLAAARASFRTPPRHGRGGTKRSWRLTSIPISHSCSDLLLFDRQQPVTTFRIPF